MRPKLFFILIIAAVAYLLGSKGGTARYNQVAGALSSIWNDPKVKKARKQASKDAAKAAKKARKRL
ncbi:hypothetical protein AX769_01715 [Frondihabitans sp. PAMC 28766]|uniref:hypothetical protein n=1 Tax=Frondihabitans sp. PAMC 28766 TaxID=1795630 RepID=UPI00078E7303|nr:hypothetical protein [Frondihabitans sp. PAMC 28766]AMM19086.1 hypothetical protein AX769_01715 [Frondihabitans sp. PAMC 28766]